MSKINVYTCTTGHKTITKDTEPSTITPMFITCPECKQRASSCMYMCDQEQVPTYEWFIPTNIEEMKEACLPIYGDVFSKEQYQEILEKITKQNGPGMYRKIKNGAKNYGCSSFIASGISVNCADIFIKNTDISKVGRNDACPCRSGKKFKNCCLNKIK